MLQIDTAHLITFLHIRCINDFTNEKGASAPALEISLLNEKWSFFPFDAVYLSLSAETKYIPLRERERESLFAIDFSICTNSAIPR